MRLIFVRHGESEANLLHEFSNRGLKHGLTNQGRQQSLALARKLQGLRVSRLFSSPLLRAIETAGILAGELGLAYKVSDALREYDCGILEGRSDAVSWQRYQAVFEDWVHHGRWETRVAGGESFLEIQDRFVPFVERLVEECRDSPGSLLLVGHGGLYRCMLPRILVNIDVNFALAHPIGHTDPVVAQEGPDGLVCLEWCDREPFG